MLYITAHFQESKLCKAMISARVCQVTTLCKGVLDLPEAMDHRIFDNILT